MSDVRSELLHECFSRAAALFPDAVAIDVPPSGARRNRLRCTYAQLDQDSDRLAQTLHARGTQLEEIVVVLLPREDPTLYAAQLGVLKSGAVIVDTTAAASTRHRASTPSAVSRVMPTAFVSTLRGAQSSSTD